MTVKSVLAMSALVLALAADHLDPHEAAGQHHGPEHPPLVAGVVVGVAVAVVVAVAHGERNIGPAGGAVKVGGGSCLLGNPAGVPTYLT